MLSRLLGACAIAIALLNVAPATAQTLFRPVAVVNDSAITGFDLAQRAQILVALGFSTASADALRNQALDQLVEDRLKVQAGKRIGLKSSPEVVAAGVEQLAARSNLSPTEFRALMNAQGVTDQAVEDMAAAQVIWIQVVRSRFADRVEPGEAEIAAELNLIGTRGAFDYRLREIGLPLEDDGRTGAQTRALAEQLYNSLSQGGDFAEAVARFSKAPSASRGGDVGWVTTQQMPPNLLNAVRNMNAGDVSQPLDVAGGLSLIQVVEKRATGASQTVDPELRERVRARLVSVQSGRLADGLLQEMRRDALIEVR